MDETIEQNIEYFEEGTVKMGQELVVFVLAKVLSSVIFLVAESKDNRFLPYFKHNKRVRCTDKKSDIHSNYDHNGWLIFHYFYAGNVGLTRHIWCFVASSRKIPQNSMHALFFDVTRQAYVTMHLLCDDSRMEESS